MSEDRKPPKKVAQLSDDARHNPRLCLERLLEDFQSGETAPERLVVVVEEPDGVEIRGSGPGMGDGVTVLGLLMFAIMELYAARDVLPK